MKGIEGCCRKAAVLAHWLKGERTFCRWRVSLAAVFFSAQISNKERRLKRQKGRCCWRVWALKQGEKSRLRTESWEWPASSESDKTTKKGGIIEGKEGGWCPSKLLSYSTMEKGRVGPELGCLSTECSVRPECWRPADRQWSDSDANIKSWWASGSFKNSGACSCAAALFISLYLFLFRLLPSLLRPPSLPAGWRCIWPSSCAEHCVPRVSQTRARSRMHVCFASYVISVISGGDDVQMVDAGGDFWQFFLTIMMHIVLSFLFFLKWYSSFRRQSMIWGKWAVTFVTACLSVKAWRMLPPADMNLSRIG